MGSPFQYVALSGSITVHFTSNGSGTSSGWNASVFCATESTVDACGGTFSDPGGPATNYPVNSSTITHICADNGGQARVSFSSFNTEAGFDLLRIYDGPTIASPPISGSPFSGATSPGVVTASGTCLTFFFISDISVPAAGWTSSISCVGGCTPATVTANAACNGSVYDVSGTVTVSNPPATGTLMVSDGVFTQTINPPFNSPINYTLTGLSPGSGPHTVTAVFSDGTACNGTTSYTAPSSCGPMADYTTSSGSNGSTITACTGKFADSGNLSGSYGNNEDYSITFCSGNTQQMTLTFNNFHTEAGADLLYIYDGANTSAPQLAGSPFSGAGSDDSPGVVSSTGSCITFRFVSNGSTTHFGWDADISCSGSVAGNVPMSPGWSGYPGMACTPATKIEGTVFEDFNNNGVKESSEPFVKDVEVRLFDETSQTALTTTNVNGLYSFTGLVSGKVYRVEFTVPGGFEAGAVGTGSGSAVQFVSAGTCNANLGLLDVAHYCGVTNPLWFIPCYNNGSPSHASNSGTTGIARFLYNASGQSPAGSYVNYVTIGTIGTVWGTAYSRKDTKLFMGSFLKRHSGLGPSGIGAVYQRLDAGTNTSSTLFYNFGALAGTVADNATRFPGTGNAFGQVGPCGLCDNIDPTTFAQVGKVGLGDIELSGDEQTLYVTNLADRKIYAVNTNNPSPGSAVALPNQPWLTGSPCNNGTARPWALKYRRGKLYVGVVCDGGSSTCSKTAACNDLTATVYVFDGTSWTTALSFPLNYYRKAYKTGSNYWVRWMDNWSDFTANFANVTDAQFAQPVFANIEFDDDGSIIMGFADRTAMQTGYQAPPPPGPSSSTAERTFAHGDILRAYFNATTGVYTIENNGIAGPRTTTNPSSTSGPGGKSFYWGDYWYGAHNNAGIGALAILPGSGEVMFPVADPIDPYAAGVIWMSNTNGKANRKLEVYQGSASGNAPNFAKNGGLGDMELACGSPGIEIGNYVWWDNNLNGRMDPDEPGISNVSLRLYLDPDGNTTGNNPVNGDEIWVATTTTDDYGRYVFSFSGASNGLNVQNWQPGHTKVLPNTKYVVRILNFTSDTGLTDFANEVGSPAFIMSPTQNQGAGGGQRDNNSYDNPGNANAAVTTGGPGQNNHSYDFAFGPGAANTLSTRPTSNTPCVGESLTLMANPTGGTMPYSFVWSGPGGFASMQENPVLNNVTTAVAGIYNVTVTDAQNFTATFSIAVHVNEVSVAAVFTNASCGMMNGSIDLTVTGGIAPLNFDWNINTLDGIEDPTGLSAGNYSVSVTDDNGCMAMATGVISNGASGPSLTFTPSQPTCGNNNGSVMITPAGGTGPYTFDWSHIAGINNSQNLTGLAPGTYEVTVTDAASCTASGMVTLVDNFVPMAANIVPTNPACGNNTGALNLSVTGGSGSYTYDWDNLAGTNNPEDQSGLPAGMYVVTITDAQGCDIMAQATLTALPAPMLSVAVINETCGLANASINLTVTGGTAPYTYDWNNDGVGDNDDSEDLAGMPAGSYNVSVTDGNGCIVSTGVNISNTDGPALTLVSTSDATSCRQNNGSVTVNRTGGTAPFLFSWVHAQSSTMYNMQNLVGVPAGDYNLTLTDINGCAVMLTATVGLVSGSVLTTNVTNPTTCVETGSVDLSIAGGVAPYEIDWSSNGVGQTNDPEDLSGLTPGIYSVTVTEANGCATTASITIEQIRAPVITFTTVPPACMSSNGEIDLTIIPTDGPGPFTIDWAHIPGTSNPEDLTGLAPGAYTVTVTDAISCSMTLTINLSALTAPDLVVFQTNETCTAANGAVNLEIQGGLMPYQIDWDNNGTGQTNDPEDLNGLMAGTYNVTVTDANGCRANATVQLTNSPAPVVTAMTHCADSPATDGTATLAIDGVGPFVIDWSNNAFDGMQAVSGLSAGMYVVTVTDLNNCQTITNIEIENCCVYPSATFVPVPGDCSGITINNNGRIVLTTTVDVDKYGVSTPGAAIYDGPGYATATTLPALYANIVSNVPNIGQTYIVRVFNGKNTCFTDYTIVVPNTNCPVDPQGYIYCEETGEIVSGGTISVAGPGTFVITKNGNDGEYQFFTDGTPGIYTITYTPPVNYSLSTSRLPAGTLDPTGQPDPYIIGSGSTDGVVLNNFSAAANPFYLSIDFALGDPEVFNNNIPLQGCALSIGSTVFLDLADNGVLDGADVGIPDVELLLYRVVGNKDGDGNNETNDIWVNTGSDGDAVTPTDGMNLSTDANGNYRFSNLISGRYYVVIAATQFAGGAVLEYSNISSGDISTTPIDNNVDNDDNGLQMGGPGSMVMSPAILLSVGNEPVDAGAETGQGNTLDNTLPSLDANGNMTVDFGFACGISAQAGVSQTICSTRSLQMSLLGASVSPASIGGIWTTNGDGAFIGGSTFGAATAYQPGPGDIAAGIVTLTLATTDPGTLAPPSDCPPVSDTVVINILRVNCGSFPWNGN